MHYIYIFFNKYYENITWSHNYNDYNGKQTRKQRLCKYRVFGLEILLIEKKKKTFYEQK